MSQRAINKFEFKMYKTEFANEKEDLFLRGENRIIPKRLCKKIVSTKGVLECRCIYDISPSRGLVTGL